MEMCKEKVHMLTLVPEAVVGDEWLNAG